MDERIHRLVMSQPIPERLIRALALVPLVESWELRKYGGRRASVTEILAATLELVCHGYSNREIAEWNHYSEDAVKDHVRRLLSIFRARNRAHLAAKAVARGLVDMSQEP